MVTKLPNHMCASSWLTVRLRDADAPLEFRTGSGIVLARSFALELQNAGAAAAALTAPATAATTATATAAAASPRLTARVKAGRELRAELQRIHRLQDKGKSQEAAAACTARGARGRRGRGAMPISRAVWRLCTTKLQADEAAAARIIPSLHVRGRARSLGH